MIQPLQVTLANLGNGGEDTPTLPGWYFDPYYGWYHLNPDGSKYLGNPYTAQVFAPMAFFAKEEVPATTINADAPIAVIENDTIEVKFTFCWKGDAKTLWFRFGNCKKMPLGDYNEGDKSRVSVDVTKSTTWKSYSMTGSFFYVSGFPTVENNDLFILVENAGFDWEIVYKDAFAKLAAEIKDFAITSYGRS